MGKHLVSRKKSFYPVSEHFRTYLRRYHRLQMRGVRYQDLARHAESVPLYDQDGKDTFWASVLFPPNEQQEIHRELLDTYAVLKGHGDLDAVRHLFVDRIDLCLYGNTLPYRIRIVNAINENFDYFYVKRTDANRIYGLELEHLLSPSRIHYFVNGATTVEEHIIGVPGDVFIASAMPSNRFDYVRLAKQFVKFDTRCQIQLLGDMHTGNYVIDVTRDFEKHHYRFRPLDFDQQSHHRNLDVYCPRAYPRNAPLMEAVHLHLEEAAIAQYRKEERSLIAHRVNVSDRRVYAVLRAMERDTIADPAHVRQLAQQMAERYDDTEYASCLTMGALVRRSIVQLSGSPGIKQSADILEALQAPVSVPLPEVED